MGVEYWVKRKQKYGYLETTNAVAVVEDVK